MNQKTRQTRFTINQKKSITTYKGEINMTEDEYQLEDVYEVVFGEDAINRYSHTELMTRLHEMYNCYVKENEDES